MTIVTELNQHTVNAAQALLEGMLSTMPVGPVLEHKHAVLRLAFLERVKALGDLYAACKEGDYFTDYPEQRPAAETELARADFCLLLCELFQVDVSDMSKGYSITCRQIREHLEYGTPVSHTH